MKVQYDWLMRQINTPYRWGGDDPILGFDCSGFAVEFLKTMGMLPEGADYNAQGLFDYFKDRSDWNRYTLGALVFYGKSLDAITHMGIGVDRYRVVTVSGGGSSTNSVEKAAEQNAFTKMRLYTYRKDLVAVLRPFYTTIGEGT